MNMTFMSFSFLSFLCLPEGILLASSVHAKLLQLCLTLGGPTDCSPPGSSVHGIFQARELEWGAIVFSERVSIHIYIMGTVTVLLSHSLIRMTEKIKIILQIAKFYTNVREWSNQGKVSILMTKTD